MFLNAPLLWPTNVNDDATLPVVDLIRESAYVIVRSLVISEPNYSQMMPHRDRHQCPELNSHVRTARRPEACLS